MSEAQTNVENTGEPRKASTEFATPTVAAVVVPTSPSATDEFHPRLEKFLQNNQFLFDETQYKDFRGMLAEVISDMRVVSYCDQVRAFKRAKRMFDDLYYARLPKQAVDLEMHSAAEAFFGRVLASEGVTDNLPARIEKLVEEAHDQDSNFRVGAWEADGWGTNPIETEAHRRAMPMLLQIQRLQEGNERAELASIKQEQQLQRLKSTDGNRKAD